MMRKLLSASVVAGLIVAGSSFAPSPAIAALPGLVLVSDQTGYDSEHHKGETVWCPDGTKVISGGGWIDGDPSRVHFNELAPDATGGNGFRAAATEVAAGDPQKWLVGVYAVCANASVRPEYEEATVYGSNFVQEVVVRCDTGKTLVGFGGFVPQDQGPFNVALTVMMPAADLDRVIIQAYEEETGEPKNWWLHGYAVCVDKLPGAQVVAKTAFDDANKISVTHFCPPHTMMHATGGAVFAGAHGWLAAVAPRSDLFGGRVFAHTDVTGVGGKWNASVFLICA